MEVRVRGSGTFHRKEDRERGRREETQHPRAFYPIPPTRLIPETKLRKNDQRRDLQAFQGQRSMRCVDPDPNLC